MHAEKKEKPAPSPAAGGKLPRHLAVIMDGNGRWAKKKGWRRVRGHEEGANSVREIVRACRRLGIEALTLYAFSQENWERPKTEVKALMGLLERYLDTERQEMIDQGIRLNTIGEIGNLPASTKRVLEQTMAATAGGDKMVLTLALSYGGRQELARAARLLCEEAAAGRLDPKKVDEAALAQRLYTAGLPDPDFLIRTSGELRISNFLPWQTAYTEFYFTDTLWPEFREKELMQALDSFASRQRRFGKTQSQVEKS